LPGIAAQKKTYLLWVGGEATLCCLADILGAKTSRCPKEEIRARRPRSPRTLGEQVRCKHRAA
jgi:hypothetical protein